jgi:hypothetical protein
VALAGLGGRAAHVDAQGKRQEDLIAAAKIPFRAEICKTDDRELEKSAQ